VRIAFDTNTVFQGYGAARTYFRELLPEMLALAQPDDELFVFHNDDTGNLNWLLREEHSHALEAPFKGRKSNDLWRSLRIPSVESLAKGPDQRRIGHLDVCHSIAPPLMPSKAGTRVITLHSLKAAPTGSLRRSLRDADAIVVPSRGLKTQLLKAEPDLARKGSRPFEDRVVVIPPGVNRRYIDPPKPSEVEDLCLAHPFLEENYILVQGGASNQRGGLETILDAYRNALGTISLPPLVVLVSDTENTPFLMQAVAERSLEEQVLMLEDLGRDYLPALYRGAQFLLYPGLGGGFGTAVLEAAAAGVPSIVGPDCGVLEVIWQGLLVPDTFEAESWGEAIARLQGSVEERQNRAEQLRTEARKADWASVALKHWDIYRHWSEDSTGADQLAG